MGNEQGKGLSRTYPDGVASMDQRLQEKFAKGIHFNMKIVIRGERNSGKTALFKRLQGAKFQESYIPTEEIQVGTIVWGYKGTNDKVKVEIWDIVDRGKPKKQGHSLLKGFHQSGTQGEEESPTLDARFLDVYKSTHGVIFIFDMCKKWTWQYIERELPQVPYHIPVIIIGNYRDMEAHRAVTTDQATGFIEFLDRPEGSATVRYCECSMKDCFGLAYLHKFFSVPFLQMQQEVLLQQLQENRLQMQLNLDELKYNDESVDFNYEMYTEMLLQKASTRKDQTQATPTDTPSSGTPPSRGRTPSTEAHKIATSQLAVSSGGGVGGLGARKTQKKGRDDLEDFLPESVPVDDFLGEDDDDDDDDVRGQDGNEDDDDDEDSESGNRVNPLVAADEDFDSDDDDDDGDDDVDGDDHRLAPHPGPSSPAPVLVSSSVHKSKPHAAPPPAKQAKAKLKPVKDIQLTESESEHSAVEDDPNGSEAKAYHPKISTSGDFSFGGPLLPSSSVLQPTSSSSSKSKKIDSSSSGLLLAFGGNEPTERGEEEIGDEVSELPSKGIKKKKKKTSSKKNKQEKEDKDDSLLPMDSLDSWLGEADEDAEEAQKTKKKKSSLKEGGTKKKKKAKKDKSGADSLQSGSYNQL